MHRFASYRRRPFRAALRAAVAHHSSPRPHGRAAAYAWCPINPPGVRAVLRRRLLSVLVALAATAPAAAQSPDGGALFETHGTMREQGAELGPAERRAIAEFITGRAVGGAAAANPDDGACAAAGAAEWPGPDGAPAWNGWGPA